MVVKADADGGHESVFALYYFAARIHQQKAARAVGVLHLPRLEAALPEQRALLVAGGAGDGYLSAVKLKLRHAVDMA